jgi:deoxyribonuclease (pyrimidine dimer)
MKAAFSKIAKVGLSPTPRSILRLDMTRVNLVDPKDLADQHLFAEWREIKMVPKKARKLLQKSNDIWNELSTLPKVYSMSKGHVRFFYDKMTFLYIRYIELTEELYNRDYRLSSHNPQEIFLKGTNLFLLYGNYIPTKEALQINIERLSLRLNERPNWYRHYGKIQPPEFFIERYNQKLIFDTINGIL